MSSIFRKKQPSFCGFEVTIGLYLSFLALLFLIQAQSLKNLVNFSKISHVSWLILSFYAFCLSLYFLNLDYFLQEVLREIDPQSFYIYEDYFPFFYMLCDHLWTDISIPLVAFGIFFYLYRGTSKRYWWGIIYVSGFLLFLLLVNYYQLDSTDEIHRKYNEISAIKIENHPEAEETMTLQSEKKKVEPPKGESDDDGWGVDFTDVLEFAFEFLEFFFGVIFNL